MFMQAKLSSHTTVQTNSLLTVKERYSSGKKKLYISRKYRQTGGPYSRYTIMFWILNKAVLVKLSFPISNKKPFSQNYTLTFSSPGPNKALRSHFHFRMSEGVLVRCLFECTRGCCVPTRTIFNSVLFSFWRMWYFT